MHAARPRTARRSRRAPTRWLLWLCLSLGALLLISFPLVIVAIGLEDSEPGREPWAASSRPTWAVPPQSPAIVGTDDTIARAIRDGTVLFVTASPPTVAVHGAAWRARPLTDRRAVVVSTYLYLGHLGYDAARLRVLDADTERYVDVREEWGAVEALLRDAGR